MSKSVIDYYYNKLINNDFNFEFDYIEKNTAKEIKKEYDKNTNKGSCKKCVKNAASRRMRVRIQNLLMKKIKL
ncbi:MAG: hypothetical protein MUQ75_07880 [Crocinitomicaceae bacterium]|nr:hypothetical protein [Crocinitomicaceae bacterium]